MFWSILAGCTLFVQALNIFSSLVNSRLADAEDEISRLRIKCGLVEDYERKIQNLRDELYLTSVSKPRPLPPLLDTRYVAVVHYVSFTCPVPAFLLVCNAVAVLLSVAKLFMSSLCCFFSLFVCSFVWFRCQWDLFKLQLALMHQCLSDWNALFPWHSTAFCFCIPRSHSELPSSTSLACFVLKFLPSLSMLDLESFSFWNHNELVVFITAFLVYPFKVPVHICGLWCLSSAF